MAPKENYFRREETRSALARFRPKLRQPVRQMPAGVGGQSGIEPAGMNAAVQRFLGLGVDIALPDQAAESGLDMGALGQPKRS